MRKIIRSETSYSEPVSFDLEVYTMLKREDLDYLEKEIASLKEQLVNAVEAGEFFSKYADCKKESWACRCSFCRDVDSSRKLREARQFLENKTYTRRER